MGISPQLYRTRIGCFNCNPKSKKNKIKISMSSKNKMGQSWTSVGLFSAMILVVCTNLVILNQTSIKNSEPKSNIFGNSQLVAGTSLECLQNYRSNTIFGGNGLSVNKIQKIINGNRRSVGYKLAVWNCGRGLVQDWFSPKLM